MTLRDIAQAAGLKGDEAAELLALLLDDGGLAPTVDRIPRRDPSVPLNLSAGQQRLWFLEQLNPDQPMNNVSSVLQLPAPVDPVTLERGLQELSRRHEVLRYCVPQNAGSPAPELLPPEALTVSVTDLRALPTNRQEALARTLVKGDVRRPFDVVCGPLVRANVICLHGDDWILSVVMHHMVTDAWSVAIFARELSECCRAVSEGCAPRLEPLPIQFADFAAWEQHTQTRARLREALDWWRQNLDGMEPVTLPADRPRPPFVSHRGARVTLELQPQTCSALRDLAGTAGTTPYVVILAAIKTLISRYIAQRDICIGTIVAGRDHPDVQGLIGFFANTLVLRSQLKPRDTVRERIDRVSQVTIDAQTYGQVPFAMLVQEFAGRRSEAHRPLFDIAFSYARDDFAAEESRNASMRRIKVQPDHARFDLAIHAIDRGDSIQLGAEYVTDLFDRPRMERLLSHLEQLLTTWTADPEAVADAARIFDDAELGFISENGSLTRASDTSSPRLLLEQIAAQAAATPDAPALIIPGGVTEDPALTIGYGNLMERAGRIASGLMQNGVGTGDFVAVLLERGADLIAAMIAVHMRGAILVPLTPQIPPARMVRILGDCAAAAVITRNLPGGIDQPGLDPDALAWHGRGTASQINPVDPSQAAYVLYTSGTTGEPKGVSVPHSALSWVLDRAARLSGFGPGHRALCMSTITFDVAFLELFLPLATGGALVLVSDDRAGDMQWIAGGLDRFEATFLQTTPSVWEALVDSGWQGRHSLTMVSVGEVLSPSLAKSLCSMGGTLWNGYGPTETAIYATWYRVELEGDVTIGRPLDGAWLCVLDPEGQLCPIGVPGELHIGGAGLSHGYFNRPSLTAQHFVPDSFSLAAGARLYATGDIAVLREDGNFGFLGRRDTQVKLRGFRIELGAVETALAGHQDVALAAAILRMTDSGARLEAFVQPRSGQIVNPADINDEIAKELPSYMLPSRIHVIDKLPHGTSAKLDRRALLDLTVDEEASVGAPPNSPAERTIADVWCKLLERKTVNLDDNFFALGGDSLLAVRVSAILDSRTGVRLPLRDLMAARDLRDLADRLDSASGVATEYQPITARPRPDHIPIAPGQLHFWRISQVFPSTSMFNLSSVFLIPTALDPAALVAAGEALVRRHESLRTLFETRADQPVLSVQTFVEPEIRIVELTELDEDTRIEMAFAEASRMRMRPMNLGKGEIFRILAVKLSDNEFLVCLGLHHIAGDAWSMDILARELGELMRAHADNSQPALPALAYQFTNVALWQSDRQADLFADQLSWWRNRLGGMQDFTLPPDKAATSVGIGVPTKRIVRRLDPAASQAVSELGSDLGASPFVVVLAAFLWCLGQRAGTMDVRTSTPIANRDQPGSEHVVGPFLNTLILRADLSDVQTRRGLIETVRAAVDGALAHQDVPLEMLLSELDTASELPRDRIARIQFTRRARMPAGQGTGTRQADMLGIRPPSLTSFDLTAEMDYGPGGLELEMNFSSECYFDQTVQHLIAEIECVLIEPDFLRKSHV